MTLVITIQKGTVHMNEDDLIYRLRKRAEIRRSIQSRKSVQEGKPDRIADLLEEAANEIYRLENLLIEADDVIHRLERRLDTDEC